MFWFYHPHRRGCTESIANEVQIKFKSEKFFEAPSGTTKLKKSELEEMLLHHSASNLAEFAAARRRGLGARLSDDMASQALHEKDECAEGREHDPEADLGREHVALGPARHLSGVGTFRREHEDRDERRDEGEVVDGEKRE